MGSETSFRLPGLTDVSDYSKFRDKAQAFLRQHQDHVAIRKLRMNQQLTATDLSELERILLESGIATDVDIRRVAEESHGLGLFVRSLVGLDRNAAKEVFAQFLDGKSLSGNQIEFVNLVVNHLTEHGIVDAARLYESPFTDVAAHGPDGIFDQTQVETLVTLLSRVKATAIAA